MNDASSIETGSELLTAAYFPNMQPNRLWRKDAHGLGGTRPLVWRIGLPGAGPGTAPVRWHAGEHEAGPT